MGTFLTFNENEDVLKFYQAIPFQEYRNEIFDNSGYDICINLHMTTLRNSCGVRCRGLGCPNSKKRNRCTLFFVQTKSLFRSKIQQTLTSETELELRSVVLIVLNDFLVSWNETQHTNTYYSFLPTPSQNLVVDGLTRGGIVTCSFDDSKISAFYDCAEGHFHRYQFQLKYNCFIFGISFMEDTSEVTSICSCNIMSEPDWEHVPAMSTC